MIYALDTNIISYLLRPDEEVVARYLEATDNGDTCVIPPVAYYEIKRGLLAANATTKMLAFNELCGSVDVGQMPPLAWDEAARIYTINRRRGLVVEDSDVFIAAFCLVNGYTLVTNNTKHFKRVEGLRFVDWKAL
ncbi:tRNA(fMet)-specific endonuclease VapC [Clostridia bacterium]|nr:tRNA(fMet)-specific endonuclease VapC [Clostridia bacterium]